MRKNFLNFLFIFISLGIAFSVLAISFEIAPKREPEARNTQVKIIKDSVIITTEAYDISGIYSVTAIVKDSEGKEVKRILLLPIKKLPDNFYLYEILISKKELPPGQYSIDIVATDWLGYSEEKFNQGKVKIIKVLDSTVFYLIDQKGNKDGILNIGDYTSEVKSIEDFIKLQGGPEDIIKKTIEEKEGSKAIYFAYECPNFDDYDLVDIADFSLFRTKYDTKFGDEKFDPKYDLNSDQVIDDSDFVIFRSFFGQKASEIPSCLFQEIEKILNQIQKENPVLSHLIREYLNSHPDYIEYLFKIISALKEIKSLSPLEHPHSISPQIISPELSCELSKGSLYFDQFKNVFESRVSQDWEETGNWKNDWETVNDAASFAPLILYQCAQKHNNKELERRANKTVEYEISLIDKIVKGDWSSETIAKAGGGQQTLIAARLYYSGNDENKKKIEIYSRLMAIGPSLALIYKPEIAEKSPVGAVWAISTTANYDFWLAELTENKTEKEIYISLGKYLLKKNLEKYWIVDEYRGYYKSTFFHGKTPPAGPIAFEQGMPLTALARAYQFTKDSYYLNRAKEIKRTLDKNLWDEKGKGYFATVSGEGKYLKFLSGNNQIIRGYLLWYQATKDEEFLNYSKDIFDFIIKELYSEKEGFFAHDTYYLDRYCSGCNFRTLDNLRIFDEILKKEKISSRDLLAIVRANLGRNCNHPEYNPIADINKDTKVNILDLILVVSHYFDSDWCEDKTKKTENPCKPDLAITDISWSPTPAILNHDVNLYLHYKNIGNLNVPSTSIEVKILFNDQILETDIFNLAFPAGEGKKITYDSDEFNKQFWKLAKLGENSIKAIIDATNQIAEPNRDNNQMAKTILVEKPNLLPSCVSLETTLSEGYTPLTVDFIGQGKDPDGEIIQYEFNFGDGSSKEYLKENKISHTYNHNGGTYIAKLRVQDNDGAWSNPCTKTITVHSYPYSPSKILHFNPDYNSGWVYLAQTKPEKGIAMWTAMIRSQSAEQTDYSAQLLYGITDTNTGKYYPGFLDGGAFSETKNEVDISYLGEYASELNFWQTTEDLSEFKIRVKIPIYTIDQTKTLTFKPPIIYESGDGIIPMGGGIDSLYVSLPLEEGFWVDFQKFNVPGANLDLLMSRTKGNHRWGNFILDKTAGNLPAGTVGVYWELLDKNNQRQPGGYTNFDLLIPGKSQKTKEDWQIEEIKYWTSPQSQKMYLRKWRIIQPDLGVNLIFETLIPNQENKIIMDGETSYFYEGMVKVFDPATGNQVGTGMLEQTHDEMADLNLKDLSKYSEKEVFLISDKNWQEVLPLVSLTTWTDEKGNIHKYPTLIYHQEDNRFDADSILWFLEQYQAKKLTAVGDLPKELIGLINSQNLIPHIITPLDFFSYWKSFKDLVYVENNYELSLLASTYASFKNIPLIIQGTSLDTKGLFYGRNVILVGNVNCPSEATCRERYTLEELQKKYVKETNTDKIILVNPNDLNIKIEETFQPDKAANSINELYSRNSLIAPILAAAKHEIILSTSSINYQNVDVFIDNKITDLKINPKYLTILASPNAIEMSYFGMERPPYGPNYWSVDAWHYSEINDGDPYLDLAVGRIFGLTTSDSSANVARSIFYEDTLSHENKILVTRGLPLETAAAEVYALGKVFSAVGYETKVTPAGTAANDWKNKFFISYNNHGDVDWAGIAYNQIPYLDNSFVITYACLTCNFKKASLKQSLFCANIIRKGGIGYIGATDVSGYINQVGFLSEIFARNSENKSIGEAFMIAKNAALIGYKIGEEMGWEKIKPVIGEEIEPYQIKMPWYTLLGDPTLKIKTIYVFDKPELKFIPGAPIGRDYKVFVPAMRFEIPQKIVDLCEEPEKVKPLYFTTAFNLFFSNNFIFAMRFEPIEGFNPNSITTSSWRLKKEFYEKKEYLWIISPINYPKGYFLTATDAEFRSFKFDINLSE